MSSEKVNMPRIIQQSARGGGKTTKSIFALYSAISMMKEGDRLGIVTLKDTRVLTLTTIKEK